MNVNWLNIKHLAVAILLLVTFSSFANENDSIQVWQWDKRRNWSYDGWERVKPKNVMSQYAGGMGFLSFGVGWEYGNSHWNSDFLIGFLPKAYSDEFHLTFTAKQTYTPWRWYFRPQFSYEPLTCGLYVNTISGEEFWQKEPGRYPNSYYNFSSKVRFTIFLGQSITFYPRSDRWRAFSFFYELSTNELYLVSKIPNSTLKWGDILRLSFGVRLQIYYPHDKDLR